MGDFIPGFLTRAQAKRAGQIFFTRANGVPGKEGKHFHLVQNEHGRWHFEEGRAPKTGGRP